ncbi:MAG: universal stress protein [Pseudonocardiaceae bacterium]|nr:MAG: universal stress protein [Pseudonocardiaceae bacterium]
MERKHGPDDDHVVVVGVDGTSTALHAVAWAATEADAHGGSLTIVHAAPYAAGEVGTRRATGILGRARAVARHERPALRIETRRTEQQPLQALVEESGRARLLVTGLISETITDSALGSVALGVLGRTSCPLAVIHSSDVAGSGIVVGTSDVHADAGALALAFAEAAAHGDELTVVHADVRRHALPLIPLVEAVGRFSSRFPQVQVQIDGARGRASEVLAARSAGARMLVVGSRGHQSMSRLLLGSTGRTLVRTSACPVVVVPHEHREHAAAGAVGHGHDVST